VQNRLDHPTQQPDPPRRRHQAHPMSRWGDVQTVFQSSLNNAIVLGVRPSKEAGLGLGTCEAVEHVPEHHRDAEARVITDAYDAFTREHGSAEHRAVRDVSPVGGAMTATEQARITGLSHIRWRVVGTVGHRCDVERGRRILG